MSLSRDMERAECDLTRGERDDALAKLKKLRGRPRVGVSAIVTRGDGKVLMGKRKGSHGAGTWSFPGGHLEHGETVYHCAERELQEETGLIPCEIIVLDQFTNDIFPVERLHYITLYVLAHIRHYPVPELMEPDKCEGWQWFPWDDMPPHDRLFLPVKRLVRTGYRPPLWKT